MASSPIISDSDINGLISRLSSKPSVQSLLVLSRQSGDIIRSSGSISRASETIVTGYASAVYRHVKASEELLEQLEEIDAEPRGDAGDASEKDDIRLLRVRTKRRELVVVPDAKFILVMFHDTPPAP